MNVEKTEQRLATLLPLKDATTEAVEAIQRRKLDVLMSYVRANVPYYDKLRLSSHVELRDLPVVDKATLMSQLPFICAEPDLDLEEIRKHIPLDEREGQFELYRNRYYIRRTSGTTGYFGLFLWDRAMTAVAEASATRFVPTPAAMPKPVVAVSPIVVWHPLQAIFERLHNLPLGIGVHRSIELLHRIRPQTIMGSPGFVAELAGEQLNGNLRVRPRVVVVGSEQCTPLQRDLIRRAWSVDALEQYGLSEAGLIASRCPTGRFHIHADTVILELLDDRGQPVRAGEPCARVLLTRLFGPVQPIIRYQLDDLIVAGPSDCGCGWPLPTLERIEGRAKSRLWLRSRSGGGAIALSPYILIPALETTPGLSRYQIRYEQPDVMDISILSNERLDANRLLLRLNDALRHHGAIPPQIRIQPGAPPSAWTAPPGSKEHHLRASVTRDDILAAAAPS
jgi:phenylacetate-coenzyme A ligase PaaK-like adenylate-forming protein